MISSFGRGIVRYLGVIHVFFFQAEDGIRDVAVTGVQTCALPISRFLERHLRARVLHGLDHGAEHRDPDRAFELVDADLGPHVGTVALHEGGVQPVLEQVEQLRPLELLGVRQLTNRGDYITGIRRHGFLVTNPPPNARREFRPAAPAAALPLGARARPSPRRERPRCAPARARAPPPSPGPRGPRTAPNADASARVVRAPGSTPRACSGVPADRPRRATPRAPGSPARARPPPPPRGPRAPRTPPNADATAGVVRPPGSPPRAWGGAPAARPRRPPPRAPGPPGRNRPPPPGAADDCPTASRALEG